MLVEINVPDKYICDQMVTAFEGGSNYWLHGARLLKSDVKPIEKPWYSDTDIYRKSFAIELAYDDPDEDEGQGNGKRIITFGDVERGIATMSRDCPFHFGQMMDDGGDAETADVFLQCVLFGKVVYG